MKASGRLVALRPTTLKRLSPEAHQQRLLRCSLKKTVRARQTDTFDEAYIDSPKLRGEVDVIKLEDLPTQINALSRLWLHAESKLARIIDLPIDN